MIDLHCHLDLYPDPHALAAECAKRGLYILSVTTVPSAFEGTAALASTSRIRTALGLHPELVAKRLNELPLFERLLSRTRYVGEIGLDGSNEHRETLGVQCEVLAEVLRLCSRTGDKILSLHSRGATKQILDALASQSAAGRPVLHWYTGNRKQIQRASEMGCWFSVGPAMLASRNGRTAAQAMPKDRILPESDGPFAHIMDRPANPWEAWLVVPTLAELWAEDESKVAERLTSNFRRLLEAT